MESSIRNTRNIKQYFSTELQKNIKKSRRMIQEVIAKLDNTISEIKMKDNSKSFSLTYPLKFELAFFLTLEIVRYELLTSEHLSDITSDSISKLFV